MRIKQCHLDRARELGACADRLGLYHAGQSIYEVAIEDLVWVEEHADIQVDDVPLWAHGWGGTPEYVRFGYANGFGEGELAHHNAECGRGSGLGSRGYEHNG